MGAFDAVGNQVLGAAEDSIYVEEDPRTEVPEQYQQRFSRKVGKTVVIVSIVSLTLGAIAGFFLIPKIIGMFKKSPQTNGSGQVYG